MTYRRKKIWLDPKHRRFVWCLLFNSKAALNRHYASYKATDDGHYKVLGVCCPYRKVKYPSAKVSKEIGTVMLSIEHGQASVVAHEFGHAALYGFNFRRATQHPIRIESMAQEERLLHSLSFCIRQFYCWWWTVVKKGRLVFRR